MKHLALVLLVTACGSTSAPPSSPSNGDGAGSAPVSGACVKTGCSGTICADAESDVMTTCEFKAEYACYPSATCERQAGGACGWTQTDELKACLANPPPVQ
jgi:hypothetical protein